MLLGFLFLKIFGAALSALHSRFFLFRCLRLSPSNETEKELHSGRAAVSAAKRTFDVKSMLIPSKTD